MRRETTFLLNVVLALALLGVLMVYSAGTVRMYGDDLIEGIDTFYYLRRHLLHLALGLVGLIVASRFDYHHFRDRRVLGGLLAVTFVVLVVVLVLSVEQKGAVRWLRIAGFGFQPSEFAKMALLIWLAVKLSENQENIAKFWRGYVPTMVVIGFFCLLILAEYDLGTPVIIGSVTLMMCLMAGVPWKYVGGTVAPGVVGVLGIATTSDYWWDKIIAYLDPWANPERGYQLIQSLGAFARGGVWGKGLGASEQKLEYLPEAHNDFIFAVWGEEMGLIGTLALVALFVLFLILAQRIAVCAPDLLGSLLAAGIASLICFQAGFNMAVTTGLLPTKGLVLPFISAGGSALIMNLTLVGILLNVGWQAVDPERERRPIGVARPASY